MIGAIALHGPHQGAQKSTTTGVSAPSTSSAKVASFTSVSSATAGEYSPPSEAAEQGLQAEGRDAEQRLADDRPRELGLSGAAVDEDDRDLDDAEPGPQHPIGELDLEGVAPRRDGVEVDGFESAAAKALEPAGQVVDRNAEDELRVETAAPTHEPTHEPPISRSASRHVAGAEHEVGLSGGSDEPGKVGRAVREVTVHLDDEVGAGCERLPEPRQVRRAEALLARAVQHVEERAAGSQLVGELAGPVGGVVVDDEDSALDASPRERLVNGHDEWLEVLALVVGGEADHEHPHIIAGIAETLPRNDELAATFELLADLLELDGADAFRLAAYRRAAGRIRESAVPVAKLALEGKATRLSGIGATIEKKIVEIARTGDLEALAKLRARIPTGLVDVMHVPGLGPKTARKLWLELGVTSLDELRVAAEAGRLRALPGLGPKTEEKVLQGLRGAAAAGTERHRHLLGRVLPFIEAVVAELRADPASDRVSEAGSVRRRVETVKDVDVIATATDPEALIGRLVTAPWVADVVARGQTKATVVSGDGLQLDFRVVPPACYGNLLQHFTGSKAHNVALREDAVRRGLSVSEYGVETVETGEVVTHATEEELYAYLGYAWIPPELREGAGELEAARAGMLPALVEREDVRGDLHVHTDWSDGRATLEEMVVAAQSRGYEYVAVCDHAGRLRGGRLEAQAERIAELNARLDGLRVLSGVEVDIRADGSLGLDDAALAARDWVVASVHSDFDEPPERITARILAAIEHPYVDCIGHPTGRRIGRRAPVELDLEAIVARAVETGTCLEINGQPERLDLRDAHVRLAVEAGARLVVSSDAHSVEGLAYLDLAVATARRGWATASSVLNTLPWAEIGRRRSR